MRHYDEELRELQAQVGMKNRLESKLKELRTQKNLLEEKLDELYQVKNQELLDVERLERRSLANYFYQVVGKKDEMLTKEKQEAYEATVKYDAAYHEMKLVEADIREKELEYGRIRRCNEKYQEVLKEKMEAVKLSGTAEAEEIFRLEAQVTSLDTQMKELDEAISAGDSAQQIANSILESLSGAKDWGTWDMIGGGLIADVAKHSHLDDAQDKVEMLQGALRRFKTELVDVQIVANMQVNIDGFLRFADYFFDGLFADWTVMSRINDAQWQVKNVKEQISSLLGKLYAARASVKSEQTEAKSRLQELVKKSVLP